MPKDGPSRRPTPPHHAAWRYNFEKELPLSEGIDLISKIVARLKDEGRVVINSTEVKPADPAFFVIRCENTPHGSEKLKIEIEWSVEGGQVQSAGALPSIQ